MRPQLRSKYPLGPRTVVAREIHAVLVSSSARMSPGKLVAQEKIPVVHPIGASDLASKVHYAFVPRILPGYAYAHPILLWK